ncbi:SMR family transporter [Melaminivora alkalimesophila]
MPASPMLLLGVAIAAEVVATTALKASQGFTRLAPSLLALAGYGIAFFCLARVMNHMSTGVVYAIWSGLGIFLIAIAGWLLYGQRLDLPALVGMGLIIAGVLVIQLLSRTASH